MTQQVCEGHAVRSLFQPIVDLSDGALVAVEALSRGGAGSPESPTELFAAAAAAGTTAALDTACLRAALCGVATGAEPTTLFVNIEPATLSTLSRSDLAELEELTPAGVQVVLEVTERDLLERPADLLRGARGAREIGWRVALDDVGAEPAGLALVSFLRPDVIKLDLALVRGRTSLQAAAVVNAVRADAERSGALVLAEGIETEEHLERALAMGARLGQGWMFGRPGELPTTGMRALPLRPLPPAHGAGVPAPVTPFAVLAAASEPQRAGIPLLASMTRQVERQALLLDEQTVVLANFQHADLMSARTCRRYETLGRLTALTAVTGAGMPDEPAPGVVGTALDADDPLTDQWVVTVVSPHFAAALAAREVPLDERGDRTGSGAAGRRLDYVLTYDRPRVLEAAGLLLEKTRPAATGTAPAPRPAPAAGDPVPRVTEAELPDLMLRAVSVASNGIVIADARRPDQPLVYANAAFLRLTGYQEAEVLGRNCRFLQGQDTDRNQVHPIRRRLVAGRDVDAVLLNYRRDGSAFWNEMHISAVRDAHGEVTHLIGSQFDVTARVDRERRTAHLAHHDELTGLPNRAHVLEHLNLELRRARRNGGSVAAVLLDLDDFKAVNDRFGHAVGDAALVGAAARLRSAVRAGDLLGRLGGDEFLVVLAGLPGGSRPDDAGRPTAEEMVQRVQEHLRAALDTPLQLPGTVLRIRASSGAAVFPADADEPASLLACADAAMYRTKRGPAHRRD
ncbi:MULTISPECIES: diguanylate cyclase domain-containing protein [unclassified Modestobacter]|uniref:diguanylate cyclase domain-containing protein n=1 Tax=unclassified Modestobacter TaxID=2643866 RepID=UPI0022AA083D|nr:MULTISPECIES: diguanylate cyclase [unclassified Modestobacter]MCZ2826863.1 diguanylate cyclase [Modestobacter sp. VKM Ac-2981]MCZ2855441.1 diguanylate cyclase [Modestobacter sp. VKM Ac-2982]